MRRNLERDLRRRIAEFVADRISLQKFNRWFVPATWDIEDAPKAFLDLVNSVKGRLCEYDAKYWSKDALRQELASIVGSYPVLETNEFTVRGRIIATASKPTESRRELLKDIHGAVEVNPALATSVGGSFDL